jgi:hexosaminidase
MRYYFSIMVLFMASKSYCQDTLQLAPPLMKYASTFFKNEMKISLFFAQEGAVIRYTTNGKIPTEIDAVYEKPIIVTNNNTNLTAKVFAKNYLASDAVSAIFIKEGLAIKQIAFSEPHQNYKGTGSTTLHDNKGGFASYTNNTWLGFNTDSVVFNITLSKQTTAKKTLLNILQDYGSWIFFPTEAKVLALNKKTGKHIAAGAVKFIPVQGKDVSTCKAVEISFFKKIRTDEVQLKLYLLKQIPAWHPGSGQRSWIFIDEIKVY